METVGAALVALPRLEGQRARPRLQCEEYSDDDVGESGGVVAGCGFGPDGGRRGVTIGVEWYIDAEHAAAQFNWDREPPGTKYANGKVLRAPDLGEASKMIRLADIGCVYILTILEGNVSTTFYFAGIGKASHGGSGWCRTWDPAPIAYARRAYSIIADTFRSP